MDGLYTLCLFTLINVCLGAYVDPHCSSPGGVIVQLFEWKWTDVALECERFLSQNGFCAVQVSPVVENVVFPRRPWWERYETVSYKLDNRSGNETQFVDMVNRCKAVGIRVYVQVVVGSMATINMTGSGTAGSQFGPFDYPAVPFSKQHFNTTCNARTFIPTCPLNYHGLTLASLNLLNIYVQDRVASFLNHLIDFGVAGFLIDKAGDITPSTLHDVLNKLKDLPEGDRPFIYMDIDSINNAGSQYGSFGYVTNSDYVTSIASGINDFSQLANLILSNSTSMFSPVQYVENEISERNRSQNASVITFESESKFKLATAFMLGTVDDMARVMSSYYFGGNSDIGPPHHFDYSIKDVGISPDGSCDGGWVCEHRWPAIVNMVAFKNAVVGMGVNHVYSSTFAFGLSRGDRGFFVMTKSGSLDVNIQTGMAPGVYCDIVTNCSRAVTIGTDGVAHVVIKHNEEPVVALVNGNLAAAGTDTVAPSPSTNTTWQRTVIFIELSTIVGQYIFIRGGFDNGRHPECVTNHSLCEIPIKDRQVGVGDHYAGYNAWMVNDHVLSWGGAEMNQGRYNGVLAQGTPTVWTTNIRGENGYNTLNMYGPHYWMVDLDMDCSRCDGGWFELKTVNNNGEWESDISGWGCLGSAIPPYRSHNHLAQCGKINIFHANSVECEIKSFP